MKKVPPGKEVLWTRDAANGRFLYMNLTNHQ